MRKFALTICVLLSFLPQEAFPQLTVQPNPSASSLAAQLQGSGVQISNVQITCDSTAFGFFQGTSELPITNGIALTTGHLSDIIGPSDTILANTCLNTTSGGWTELTNYLLTSSANDYCRISFTAIPIGDSLKFGYCFGSEQYSDGGINNDICGVFLTGPDPLGGQYDTLGITWIGNSNFPVSVSNVNSFVWQPYFVSNTAPSSQYFSYGGLTIYMRHSIPVVPGQPYYISMSIADADDCNYDSGLFVDSFFSDSIATGIAETESKTSADSIIELFDLSGRSVWKGKYSQLKYYNQQIPSGIYIMQNGQIREKIALIH